LIDYDDSYWFVPVSEATTHAAAMEPTIPYTLACKSPKSHISFTIVETSHAGERTALAADVKIIMNALAGIVCDQESVSAPDLKAEEGEILGSFAAPPSLALLITDAAVGPISPATARVYIDPADIGHPKKLVTAIQLPITALLSLEGKKSGTPLADSPVLRNVLLHELIHAFLIGKKASAHAIWHDTLQPTIDAALKGVSAPNSAAVEVTAQLYLMAEEECFAHTIADLYYPPAGRGLGHAFAKSNCMQSSPATDADPTMAGYQLFAEASEALFRKEKVTVPSTSLTLFTPSKGTKWTLSYFYPMPSSGSKLSTYATDSEAVTTLWDRITMGF
jgi:hypothetical protein